MSAENEAVQALLEELNTGMADVVAAVEQGNSNSAQMVQAIVAAITAAAPRVTVQPAPVVMPEPAASSGWEFEIDTHPDGRIKCMRAFRI